MAYLSSLDLVRFYPEREEHLKAAWTRNLHPSNSLKLRLQSETVLDARTWTQNMCTQRLQYPLIKEYTLNLIRVPIII